MTQNLIELISLADEFEKELPPLQLPDGHPSDRPMSAWIDHTLLKPEATPEQIEVLCSDALQYQFASVCINPVYVPRASRLLNGSNVLVCTVIGFPLGATLSDAKADETRWAIEAGAQEVDMVQAIGLLRAGHYEAVAGDIQRVVEVAHPLGAKVKVILENALLSRREKIIGCMLARMAGADFVKTSTGFSTGGATREDVELMRRVVGLKIGVKAAGGVRSLDEALMMLNAGATRLGTSSGVKIVQEAAGAGPNIASSGTSY